MGYNARFDMGYNARFDDIPFGDYDTTPGTERFPDGWYNGLVREVKNAGEKDGRLNVKIVVELDDLPTVQRTMGVAWGSKDGEPAAWVAFLSSVMHRPIGDSALRAATPKSVRGRRGAFRMKWNADRGFMDIIDFGPEGFQGGRRPDFDEAHDREPTHRRDSNDRNGEDAHRPNSRQEQERAHTQVHQQDRRAERSSRAQRGQGDRAVEHPHEGGLRVVGGTGNGVDPKLRERYSPGQLRIVVVGGSLGMSEEDALDFVERKFNVQLPQVADGQVALITNALREAKKVRAAS
jgi:hypothetical protein